MAVVPTPSKAMTVPIGEKARSKMEFNATPQKMGRRDRTTYLEGVLSNHWKFRKSITGEVSTLSN